MGLWEQFPYANFHEINIQWLLQALKDLEQRVKQLEDVDIRQLIVEELHIMIDDGSFDELFERLLAPIRAAIAELESLVESNTDDIADLNASQVEQDELISGLRSDMTEAQQQILEIIAAIQILDPTGDIGDIAETIAEMQLTIDSILARLSDAETAIGNHETRITALENGGTVPYILKYESKDCTELMTFYEFLYGIHEHDGSVLIGNYYNVTYTDPENYETASATVVCADIGTALVRNTKHYAYGKPVATASGYFNSNIKVYADLLVQAICDTVSWSLTPRSVAIADHTWLQISGQPISPQPTTYVTEAHYGLLLSSVAVFGYPCFGTVESNGFNKKLAIFDYETPSNDMLLSDVVTNADLCIHDSPLFFFDYPTNCFVKSLRTEPYCYTLKETYDTQYTVEFAFKV